MSYIRLFLSLMVWMVSCDMSAVASDDLREVTSAPAVSSSRSSASTAIPKRRVVWDIDECICWKTEQKDIEAIKKRFPECIIMDITIAQAVLRKYGQSAEGDITYPHVFGPHMECVFEYVQEQGWVNAFFSSGISERNEPLVCAYFRHLQGDLEYQNRCTQGHYKVYSKHHLSQGAYGQKAKDLKVVLEAGETLDNTILAEDDDSYRAKGQEFMLKGRWHSNPFHVAVALGHKAMYFDEIQLDHTAVFALNHAYYFLGVLESCAESLAQDVTLSLRGALEKNMLMFLPPTTTSQPMDYYPEVGNPKVFRLLMQGLKRVQKKHPSARLYIPDNKYAKAGLLQVMKAAGVSADISAISFLEGFDQLAQE